MMVRVASSGELSEAVREPSELSQALCFLLWSTWLGLKGDTHPDKGSPEGVHRDPTGLTGERRDDPIREVSPGPRAVVSRIRSWVALGLAKGLVGLVLIFFFFCADGLDHCQHQSRPGPLYGCDGSVEEFSPQFGDFEEVEHCAGRRREADGFQSLSGLQECPSGELLE